MLTTARRVLGTSGDVRGRIVRAYVFLVAFNVAAWGIALAVSAAYPILLPTAFLAYTFGLRHAVDADHIAAIDNTTRKLMQEGQRPVGVGLFFSLGHSTIVVALSYSAELLHMIMVDDLAVDNMALPAIHEGLLALMGISQAGYLGGKSVTQTPTA